jgi:gamma-glutamylcyclotransferase (GGCT)/AIG2-like uncharacterized protein YtfP
MKVCGPKSYLFVYGTLMRRHQGVSPVATEFSRTAEYIDSGVVGGLLYLVRDHSFPYPAFIPREGFNGPLVRGEIWSLAKDSPFWASLDDYEGVGDRPPLYSRQTMAVRRPDGRVVQCQLYVYQGQTSGLKLLEQGVF